MLAFVVQGYTRSDSDVSLGVGDGWLRGAEVEDNDNPENNPKGKPRAWHISQAFITPQLK